MKKTKLLNIQMDEQEKVLSGPEDNVTNMNSPEVIFDLKIQGYNYDEEEEVTSESSGTITRNHDKELFIDYYIPKDKVFTQKKWLE